MTTTRTWFTCLDRFEHGPRSTQPRRESRHTLTTGTRRAPYLVAKIMPDYPITPATAGWNGDQRGSQSPPVVAGLTERRCTADGCVVGVVHVVPMITLEDGTEIRVPDDTFTSDCECCGGLGFHAVTADACENSPTGEHANGWPIRSGVTRCGYCDAETASDE